MTQKLFRQQAIEERNTRSLGEVLLRPKLSHTATTVGIAAFFILGIAFLSFSYYTRKETVLGWLEPSTGLVDIYAERGGVVDQILVHNGQFISQGDRLLHIREDRILADGTNLAGQQLKEFENQLEILTSSLENTHHAHRLRIRGIDARVSAANQKIALIDVQVETITEHLALVTSQLDDINELVVTGQISKFDVDRIRSDRFRLINQKQELLQSKVAEVDLIEQLRIDKEILDQTNQLALSNIEAEVSNLQQKVSDLSIQTAQIITSPRDGVVSNIRAAVGQRVTRSLPLLAVVPADATQKAILLVPARSAGFVSPGQKVRIRYDAYPYQRFGSHNATISEVSDSIELPANFSNKPLQPSEAVYVVVASIEQQEINIGERTIEFRYGLTLMADIEIESRSLLEWIFDPLYRLREATLSSK